MGYDLKSFTVAALVSRHNSPRDEEHDELYAELLAKVQAIVDDPRFEPIKAELY